MGLAIFDGAKRLIERVVTLVIFDAESVQPTMLADQFTVDAAHDEQYKKIRVNEQSGRWHRLIPQPQRRVPSPIGLGRPRR